MLQPEECRCIEGFLQLLSMSWFVPGSCNLTWLVSACMPLMRLEMRLGSSGTSTCAIANVAQTSCCSACT
jgi:hypothetical protein